MKKRISFITMMVLAATWLPAQDKVKPAQRTSFGLRAGVNFQTINGKDVNENKLDNDMLTGFHAGFNAEIPIAGDFYLQPGLLFTIKGAENEESILGETFNRRLKISYLELPVNFLFKPQMGTGRLLLGFGPYVALGMGGRVSTEGGGTKEVLDVKFQKTVSSSDPGNVSYFKPLDAGAGFLAGYEFANRMSVQLNAQLGLTKINPEYEAVPNDQTSAKHTGFGLSLGIRF